MRTFVVPDTHGRYGLLLGLLTTADIIVPEEEGFSKTEGVRVVSLGDLANCVSRDVHGDLKCLRLVEDGIIDVYLVGNHEHPYITGDVGATFGGFKHFPEIEQPLRRFYFEGKLLAAYEEANILVTHAGLVRSWEGEFENAADAARSINDTWQYNPAHDMFVAIPYQRNGRYPEGGILWADWMEAKSRDINQLVGHTPQRDKVPVERKYSAAGKEGHWTVNIDWGGKLGYNICGVWIEPDGALTPVYYQRQDVPSLGIFID